jgi:hypothetical protein
MNCAKLYESIKEDPEGVRARIRATYRDRIAADEKHQTSTLGMDIERASQDATTEANGHSAGHLMTDIIASVQQTSPEPAL